MFPLVKEIIKKIQRHVGKSKSADRDASDRKVREQDSSREVRLRFLEEERTLK